ncbi:uncharacterized protein LOC122506044 [Leptopilina heterotoma]|uniref:uncharacterized protein LOC122506044 n=1 Tax=Leptopilina heterotoma TaxID=63436 RepID=UPI001CA7C5BA|nr:uncharacterized protein LOC122506044 [Leptopilina heterotoma]
MFWSSLEDYNSTSSSNSSDSEEFLDSVDTREEYEVSFKNSLQKNEESSDTEKRLLSQESKILCRAETNSHPFIQCQETDSFYDNESLSMALDRFKQKNHFPSEQTLMREDILKTLTRLERLIKQQEKMLSTMECDLICGKGNTSAIDLYQYKIHETYENRLLQGTQQLFQSLESLRIQLKRIGLIEDERIHLIERVYSLPSSQRQLYGHLIMLEKEKLQLTQKLQDYDKMIIEREDLKKQVNVLVENCLQMERELRNLRRNNKTEELLNELNETSTHKDQLRMQLDKIVKDGPKVLRVCGESITKIVEERDQLRLKQRNTIL